MSIELQPKISSENKNCTSLFFPAPIERVTKEVDCVIKPTTSSGTHSISTPHAPVFSISLISL